MRALLLLCLLPCAAAADYSSHPRVAELVENLRRDHGFSAVEIGQVMAALEQAEKLPQLIEQEQKAPEKTQTWTQYAKRVDPVRIRGGLNLLSKYPDEFARAEEQYGVPAPVIAGVLGIETNFGGYTGKIRVLDSLATQGLDHPTRSPFFLGELTEFFAFCRDFGFAPEQPAGSYAGAMGAAQFMPSNYRQLAVDFDGDGRRNLWNLPDAIGSIAHYLTRYRPELAWRRGEPVMVRAVVVGTIPAQLERNGKRPIAYLHQLQQLGIRSVIPLPADSFVGLIELPLDDGSLEYWLGLPNFYSVMTYNPRTFYAMAVAQLAAQIAEQLAAQTP